MHKHFFGYSVGKSSPSPDGTFASTQHSFSGKNKFNICQWCNKRGHIARFCFKIANNPNVKPIANAATIPKNSSHWLIDSGASHHITNDFGNLSLHNEYLGTDHLTVADGNTYLSCWLHYIDISYLISTII